MNLPTLKRLDATLAELTREHDEGRIGDVPVLLKPTCTANGLWVLAPAPQSDADWIRQHINTGKSNANR